MTIPESVLEEIRARAKEFWPDDKDMREYHVREEIDGYRKYQSICSGTKQISQLPK